jgi:hypothetical protein
MTARCRWHRLVRKVQVVTSLEDAHGSRCVDILQTEDGRFVFKEFRRDPEDAGRWTLVADYSETSFPTKDAALSAAAVTLPWFGAMSR